MVQEIRQNKVFTGLLWVLLFGLLGGLVSGSAQLLPAAAASSTHQPRSRARVENVQPFPQPPLGPTIGLNVTSGSPGTHLLLAASGYQAGELVRPYWDYHGPGTGTLEKSYYYFNPTRAADAGGMVQESLFVPTTVAGDYIIALIGANSGLVKTASFQLTPSLDPGLYSGPGGSLLRLNGWGFGASEVVTLTWDWTTATSGQTIGTITTNKLGYFTGMSFVVPAGSAGGSYIIAGQGGRSQLLAKVTFIVAAPTQGPPPRSTDWSNFGFDLQNTRVNPTETSITPANVATLSLKWRSPAPIPYKTTGEPLVANGIVYVADVQGILSGHDALSGTLLWSFYARAPIYGSPVIQNGIAYFGSVAYPFGGVVGNQIYALDALTGALLWDAYLPLGALWVTPLVANGRVYVPSALKEGTAGGLSAFDATSGSPIWSVRTSFGNWAPLTLDPAQQNLYVGTGNPCIPSGPANDCAGFLLDLDPATGQTRWSTHFPDIGSDDDDVPTAPTYSAGRLYLGLKSGIFYCLDATTGQVLWSYDTGARGDNGIFSNAAIAGGLVFFGGGDHRVHALHSNDGSLAWTFNSGSTFFSSPSLANGVLFIGGVDRSIYALNPATGAKLWSYRTAASLWSSPTISGGCLYVSGGDGYTYAFSPGGS